MKRILLATLTAVIALTAIPADAAPDQHPRYVVILRNPKVLLAQPNASAAARFTDPDFSSAGGSLVEKWGRYRVVDIASEAIASLLRNPAVESIQRVFTGAPLPDPVTLPASALHGASESLHARSDASWDSGTYAYDGAGNIKTIGSKSYQYDSAGRLVQYAESGTAIETYAYDSFGNLVEKVTAGQTLSIPIDTGSNRQQGVEYDLNGNVRQNGIDTYRSDPLNMMQRRNSGLLEQFYFYTADDERIAVYNGNDWRITVRDFDGHAMREWDAGWMSPSATWSWIEDHIYRDGQPLAADRDAAQGGTRHFHLDHLGTPRLITNQSGSGSSAFGYKLAQHDYYPFGVEQTSTIQETTNFGYDRSEPQQFTGHERDSGDDSVLAAGNADYLDYMHARYYAPAVGRFISVDAHPGKPERPQSWNRYSYAFNNPVRAVDPNGMWPTETHELMLQKAFPGLNAMEMGVLMRASADADGIFAGGQNRSLSYTHGMRAPWQSVGEAQSLAAAYYKKQVASARAAILTAGNRYDALYALGKALHLVMDLTSPAHRGFQVWNFNPSDIGAHMNAESRQPTTQETELAIAMMRVAFEAVFGDGFLAVATGNAERPSSPSASWNPINRDSFDRSADGGTYTYCIDGACGR